MLYNWLRVFKRNGATLTDLSLKNQDDSVLVPSNLASTEYLYLAQNYPFNNFFYWKDVANSNTATMKVEYWNGQEWKLAVDVLDASYGFSESGNIQFSPDNESDWQITYDTSVNGAPSELNSIKIYDCYWCRVSFDVSLSALTSFKKIAYAFTSTQQLNKLDVEINTYYTSFEVGKTDWIKEILTASELMVQKLKTMGVIVGVGQILKFEDITLATDFKCLSLIYSNLGKSKADEKKEAEKNCDLMLTGNKKFTIDNDNNARISSQEIDRKDFRLQR
jgi:hypothetical protein